MNSCKKRPKNWGFPEFEFSASHVYRERFCWPQGGSFHFVGETSKKAKPEFCGLKGPEPGVEADCSLCPLKEVRDGLRLGYYVLKKRGRHYRGKEEQTHIFFLERKKRSILRKSLSQDC